MVFLFVLSIKRGEKKYGETDERFYGKMPSIEQSGTEGIETSMMFTQEFVVP